jgi:hypothetical protein
MRSFLLQCVSLLATFLFLSSSTLAGDTAPPRISNQTRQEIIHAFSDELVYIRTNFPMGKTGLKLKDGALAPSGQELQQLIALWGPAAKPGDRARISQLLIKDDHIHLEINGGPVKKQKWYQRITLEGTASSPAPPSDPQANARGSFVDLYFDKYVPDLTGPELKLLLRPVFDFDSKSAVDAYLQTVTPQVRDAIKAHHVLVGMNHDMVIYAKGRPPKKLREHVPGDPDNAEYEEWIYGEPPQDVDFVRFIGDEVVRVETMKVDGQKIVRADKEIDLGTPTVAAKKSGDRPGTAPTLRRPGEQMPDSDPLNPTGGGKVIPPPAPLPGPDSGGPNFSLPSAW